MTELVTQKSKTSQFRSEAALMESFEFNLQRRLNSPTAPGRGLLRELDRVQGRADLVDVHIKALPPAVSPEDLAISLSSPTKARIIATLKHNAPRSHNYLARVTGLSEPALAGHIRQLVLAGLVEVRPTSAVALSCPLPWSMVEFIAYEGKLSNWRRALHQAISYRSFCRSVWIVMPASSARHAMKVEGVFRANGIGLTAVQEDGRFSVEIRSRKYRRPTSRRLYLLAVGVVLSRILGNEEAITLPHLT